MDKKTKRTLFIAGIVEAAIILFCLIVSILVIVTYNKPESGPNWQQMNLDKNGPLIGWFQNNPTPFFLIIVLPLLVIPCSGYHLSHHLRFQAGIQTER